MRARFLEPAATEVDEAIIYLDQQRPGLGERFERDLHAAIRLLVEHPLSGKALTKLIRKFRLRVFPYNVIYAVDGDEIVVVAVAHHKRRPRYWRDRLARFS